MVERSWFRCVPVGLLALGLAACSRSSLTVPPSDNPCLLLMPSTKSNFTVSADLDLARTDILFLIDDSSSMFDEIEQIRSQLVDVLIPQIREKVSDSHIGVAVFSDFPSEMYGLTSHPYQLLQPLTDDEDKVLAATRAIKLEYGGDEEESQLEALYQAATGEGINGYVPRQRSCPPGTHGGACFRDDAFGTIMLFTDAPMRGVKGLLSDGTIASDTGVNQDAADAPYIPNRRTYEGTIKALTDNHLRVLGLWSGTADGRDDISRVALDSGALDPQGQPIVFDIGTDGRALGSGVLGTLTKVATGVRYDVSLRLADADRSDGLDPSLLVQAVRAVRATPESGATLQGSQFVGVVAGTKLEFELSIDTASVPAEDFGRRYPLEINILTSDGTSLSRQLVDVVVQRGATCAASSP